MIQKSIVGRGTLRALYIIDEFAMNTPAMFARLMWPKSPCWKRISKCGKNGKGGGMALAAGGFLGRLKKRELIEFGAFDWHITGAGRFILIHHSEAVKATKAKYHLHICMEDGCWKRNTTACFLPDYDNPNDDDGKPDYYYCGKHASRFFCRICGQFWAGIESFDFSHPGLCDNCYDQIEADSWEGEEDSDEDWGGYETYPV